MRSCDGKYFPLTMRGNASPAQTCQAFLPGERHQGLLRQQYRQRRRGHWRALRRQRKRLCLSWRCAPTRTCNGRSPSGLAPVDLTLDTSLRSGDVVATTDGLVAYTGVRLGTDFAADFTPIASYPGLTADVRAPARRNKGRAGQRRDGRRRRAASRDRDAMSNFADRRLIPKIDDTEAGEAGGSELDGLRRRIPGRIATALVRPQCSKSPGLRRASMRGA